MELKCASCGNTEGFTVFAERQLDMTMVDGEIKMSPETVSHGAYLPFAAVMCDCCLSRDVKMPEDFRGTSPFMVGSSPWACAAINIRNTRRRVLPSSPSSTHCGGEPRGWVDPEQPHLLAAATLLWVECTSHADPDAVVSHRTESLRKPAFPAFRIT